MHLNKILDQIKHHPSPTEAIDKLGKALEKHEGSLLEKGFQILKSELCANVYEAINGPLTQHCVLFRMQLVKLVVK